MEGKEKQEVYVEYHKDFPVKSGVLYLFICLGYD